MTTAPAALDRIRRHLVGLRMPRSLGVLEHLLRQLERGETSALEAIDQLLDEELSLREGRRVKAALKMGRLLNTKTLAGFDFSFQPPSTATASSPWPVSIPSTGARSSTSSARPVTRHDA